jgi:hypothetical protein
MSARPIGDDAMVRKASRRVAVQAAGLVALAMLLLVVLVTVVVVHGQSAAADNMVRSTVRMADDVGDPPPGTWLVMGGKTSPGLPEELAAELTKLRSGAGPQLRLTNLAEADGVRSGPGCCGRWVSPRPSDCSSPYCSGSFSAAGRSGHSPRLSPCNARSSLTPGTSCGRR